MVVRSKLVNRVKDGIDSLLEYDVIAVAVKSEIDFLNIDMELTNIRKFCFWREYMIYSFDIFDTLISRITYTPLGIFVIMQQMLQRQANKYTEYFKNNFAKIRIEAEKSARMYSESCDKEEICLVDIYRSMQEYVDLSADDITELCNLEIVIERKCMVSVESEIKLLKEQYLTENKLCLISDMYLSEQVIRGMLIDVDPVFKNLPMYVSCNYEKTKKVGSLYSYLQNRMGMSYEEWHHRGDNYHADYQIPNLLGISSELVGDWKEYLWIKELKKEQDINSLEMQFVLGIVRHISENNDSDLVKMGKSFAGIIVADYAEWIVNRSLDDKIEELYFIARDGYVLKRLVDKLLKESKIGITTKYIYGSRRAWREQDDLKARKNVISYFEENIDFNKRIAFVDANGSGISILSVADMMEKKWKKSTPVYYFSFHRQNENDKCKFYNYCQNTSDIIELLCSGTHGTTIGYDRINGKMEPIIDNTTIGESIDDYIQGILEYTDTFLKFKNKLNITINVRNIVKSLITTKKYKSGMTLKELWIALNNDTKKVKKKYFINTSKQKNAIKVIIYGAGANGKKVFDKLNAEHKIAISAWTDIDWNKIFFDGLPVVSIESAIKKDYDYVVIAIKNKMAIKSAKLLLRQLGVDSDRMILVEDVDKLIEVVE